MDYLFTSAEFQYLSILNWRDIETSIFFFMVYAFLGWVLENSYNYLTRKRFFKEGFWKGPFKPMYGFAPVLLIYCITDKTEWLFLLFLCFFIPTLIEYASGYFLEKLFRRKWWDYSNHTLHLHGHICLAFSFCWIVLSILCLKYIHPVIAYSYGVFASYWVWLYPGVILYFLGETFFAVKRYTPHRLWQRKTTNPA